MSRPVKTNSLHVVMPKMQLNKQLTYKIQNPRFGDNNAKRRENLMSRSIICKMEENSYSYKENFLHQFQSLFLNTVVAKRLLIIEFLLRMLLLNKELAWKQLGKPNHRSKAI